MRIADKAQVTDSKQTRDPQAKKGSNVILVTID